MRHKFKIMLPNGEQYKPSEGKFVVMSGQGVFFLVDKSNYYDYVTKLSNVIGNYDVIWKEI